ncbi:MAG: hypothetical protein IPH11_12825 [Ignavibacteriales bacterium]|nr:hypothetical protein [Ignavibacteriales bacterium]
MLSLNMSAGNDNDVIWVFRVNLDSSIIYLATTAITLDANDYLETIIKKILRKALPSLLIFCKVGVFLQEKI